MNLSMVLDTVDGILLRHDWIEDPIERYSSLFGTLLLLVDMGALVLKSYVRSSEDEKLNDRIDSLVSRLRGEVRKLMIIVRKSLQDSD
jgi:hypothetical protein